jgi:hypothetical protein
LIWDDDVEEFEIRLATGKRRQELWLADKLGEHSNVEADKKGRKDNEKEWK